MTEQRRTIGAEVLLVLGVSLGYSAIYSVVDFIGKLAAKKALSSQTSTLNPSHASGRPWLDLAFQLVGILFGVVPALLAAASPKTEWGGRSDGLSRSSDRF